MKNKMDLALNIAIRSRLQMALFVATVLVFVRYLGAKSPTDLWFTPLEVITVSISAAVATMIVQDGEANWMERVLLLAL